jgi:hypothetical protein
MGASLHEGLTASALDSLVALAGRVLRGKVRLALTARPPTRRPADLGKEEVTVTADEISGMRRDGLRDPSEGCMPP